MYRILYNCKWALAKFKLMTKKELFFFCYILPAYFNSPSFEFPIFPRTFLTGRLDFYCYSCSDSAVKLVSGGVAAKPQFLYYAVAPPPVLLTPRRVWLRNILPSCHANSRETLNFLRFSIFLVSRWRTIANSSHSGRTQSSMPDENYHYL